MVIFGGKKNLISIVSGAFVVSSMAQLALWILSLIPVGSVSSALENIYPLLSSALGVVFGGYICSNLIDDYRKSASAVFSIAISSLLYYCFAGFGYSIIVCVALSLTASFIYSRLELFYANACSVLLAVLLAIAFGVLYPAFYDILLFFTSFVAKRPAFFGAISNLYSVLVSDSMSDLVYHTDYSISQLVNNEIVTGAVDVFSLSDTAPAVTAQYLTGKYFSSMLLPLGLFFALFSKLDEEKQLPYICITFLSFVTGDMRLLSVFLLLYNPFVYLGYLLCIFVSYTVSRFADLRIGFVDDGSAVELIKYCHSWIYFLVIGGVLAILMYFVTQLMLSKFDFNRQRLLPRDVRRIVSALGGEDNILRVRNGKVYVANPNLIDILRLDCDIHENEITLISNDLERLTEYY